MVLTALDSFRHSLRFLFPWGTLVNRDIESSFSRDADLRTTDRSGQVSRRYRDAIDGSEEFINRTNRSIERDGQRPLERNKARWR